MKIDDSWFRQYQKMSEDEKELFHEFDMSENQKWLIVDYNKLKNAVYLLSIKPEELKSNFTDKINIINEIALIFFDEGMYPAERLSAF